MKAKIKIKHKISPLKLGGKFWNEIKNEETNIHEQIFNESLSYHSPSFSIKDLYENDQDKNYKIVKRY